MYVCMYACFYRNLPFKNMENFCCFFDICRWKKKKKKKKGELLVVPTATFYILSCRRSNQFCSASISWFFFGNLIWVFIFLDSKVTLES